MPHLLTIVATPNPEGRSSTRRLAGAHLEGWRPSHPGWTEETLDLFATPLPPLDAPMVGVLFGYADQFPAEVVAPRARALDALVGQFVAADEYLVVTPMWNFGLPYPLKHYFDLIIRPGATFDFSGEGTAGLLGGRRATVLVTSGFDYSVTSPNADSNHLDDHLQTLFAFMGITDLTIHTVGGMQLPGAEERLQAAMAELSVAT